MLKDNVWLGVTIEVTCRTSSPSHSIGIEKVTGVETPFRAIPSAGATHLSHVHPAACLVLQHNVYETIRIEIGCSRGIPQGAVAIRCENRYLVIVPRTSPRGVAIQIGDVHFVGG